MNVLPAGTGTLLRHALRRDRLLLPWWVAGVVLLYWSQPVSLRGVYATQAELDRAAAEMSGNAAFVAMAGPARALDTLGGQTAWQTTAFGAVLVAAVSLVTVVRHTRGDEESGRAELLLAGPAARHAPLVAAVLLAAATGLVAGLLVTLSLVGAGLAGAGSVSLGLGLAAVGLVFTAVAAVAVQITDAARGAYAVGGVAVAVAYALRAVGDVGDGTLPWFSPIGWYQAQRAFAGERWWPLLLPVVAAVTLALLAAVLFARRDLGRGLVAAGPGPAEGRLGATGLAVRLQRGSVVGWSLGLLAGGVAFGSIGNDVGDLLGDSDAVREVLAGGGPDLVDAFHASSLLMLALVASGFAVSSALRARAEEDGGRLELLLSTPLPRVRWVVAQLAVTVVGSVLVTASAGLGLGLGYAGVTGDGGALRFVGPALTYAVPVLVLVALVVLLSGWVPRAAAAGWAALVACVVLMFFGPLLDLPGAVVDASPFAHVSAVPAEPVAWLPLGVLGLVAVVGAAAGVAGWRHRDIS